MTLPLDRPRDPGRTSSLASPLTSPDGRHGDVEAMSIRELIAALAATEQTLMRTRSGPTTVAGPGTSDAGERARVIAEQGRLVRELRLRRRALPPLGHSRAHRR